LGFRVYGLGIGFRVKGLGFRVQGVGINHPTLRGYLLLHITHNAFIPWILEEL